MNSIKYSFIIPHKNCPLLLKRCVNSIPDRDDIQIVVIDDNSDVDKKPAIERRGLDIVLLEATQSKGAGHARNVGIEHAIGQWLLFPDCDDYYSDNFISVLDTYADKDLDVVYYNFEFRDGVTGELLPQLPIGLYYDNYDDSQDSKDCIKFRNNVPWTKMVKRDYILRNNIHFEEVVNGNDMLYSMMVGYYSDNIVVIKDKLYIYLRNKNGITATITKEGALCTFIHSIQLNSFYRSINHKEWEWPTLKIFLHFVRLCRYPFVLLFFKRLNCIISCRNEWVKILK